VQKLVENLRHKLGIFTESATSVNDPEVTESWRTICTLEAQCVFNILLFSSAFAELHTRSGP
jgi:hypothetical protein